jgi:hypothetical protein
VILHNRSVRDLAWAIGSPSLLIPSTELPVLSSGWFKEQEELTTEWLQKLDRNPMELENFLAVKHDRRLGIYFENLIEFWLRWHPNYNLLHRDLQVYEGKKTKGAFDFIVETDNGIEHWEVCVKFYLSINGSPDWMKWIGPNRRDRLGIKLARTLEKQIRLSDTAAGEETLRKVGIDSHLKRKMMVKGILFHHHLEPPIAPLHGEIPKGRWFHREEFMEYQKNNGHRYHWMTREKPNWLSNLFSKPQNQEISFDRPVMISECRQEEDGNLREVSRLFVVPREWLAAHR